MVTLDRSMTSWTPRNHYHVTWRLPPFFLGPWNAIWQTAWGSSSLDLKNKARGGPVENGMLCEGSVCGRSFLGI